MSINKIKTAFVKQDVRTAGRFDRALRKAESSVLFLFVESDLVRALPAVPGSASGQCINFWNRCRALTTLCAFFNRLVVRLQVGGGDNERNKMNLALYAMKWFEMVRCA